MQLSHRSSWRRLAWHAWISTVLLIIASPTVVSAQSTLTSYLRDVVSHHAPIIIEETEDPWPNPESQDHILPVDFDGDEIAANNAAHATDQVVTNGVATAYFSIVETGNTFESGYFFINYYFYHAQDGGAHFNSVLGLQDSPGHENDMEGVALVVKKSFDYPYGQLVAAYSEAHGALIPWINPSSATPVGTVPGGARGYIRFWHDVTFNVDRPVVAIRSQKHGTYFAQDCSGQTPNLDAPPGSSVGYGMWLNSPQQLGTFTSCIHDDSHGITYVPLPLNLAPSLGLAAQRLGPTVRDGTWWYQLEELATSPMWDLRSQFNLLFGGNVISMLGGNVGLDAFNASDVNPGKANPPWQWLGGRGQCQHLVKVGLEFGIACWHTFGEDNTDAYEDPIDWPLAPNDGQIVADPAAAARLRFPSLPDLNEQYRYNPYLASPPACCSVYPLGGTISGPLQVEYGSSNRWSAVIQGGTPPYRYQWSGVASGTGSSVTLTLFTASDVFLDVFDAAGHHAALTLFIDVFGEPSGVICPNHEIVC